MQNYLFVHPMDSLGLEINKCLQICAVLSWLHEGRKMKKQQKNPPENKIYKFNNYFWVTLNE